jgi:hypothetical protein
VLHFCGVAWRVEMHNLNASVQLRALWQRGATTTTTHSLGCGARMAMEVEHRRQSATLASCSCNRQLEDARVINGNLGLLQRVNLSSGSRTGPDSDATETGN